MKKHILRFLILSSVAFLLSSCISDEESRSQTNSGFSGEWTGSFTGDFSGAINFTVSKEGMIEGALMFSPNNNSETFGGYVNQNGKFDFNTKNNFLFSGILLKEKNSSGQWHGNASGSPSSGSFSIKKK
ncbi:hypothetical protein [uncultured Chryseobacterium sp.]|uniref:hypothetical protein n=2 Tax=uncultured Chryseobacterium sp. TaxID=259322 RepID=UPI0025D4C0EF|nr:hypothetical protein [uncultured Chryseobacterium sp.]